jgi:putative flippase GtrA
MPLQLYRYAVCGVINVFLDIFSFYVCYHFILKGQTLDLLFYSFKPHTAAYMLSFCITFPVGFLLSKYVVWLDSNIPGRVQLFRYFLMVMSNILLNVVFLKLFIEVFHWEPLVAKTVTTVIVICNSYLNQKYFAFRVKSQSSTPGREPV